jgi:heme-degrading monooxygenase HmoA
MYARVTTIDGDPQRLETGTVYVRDRSLPMAREAEGCRGLSMLADRTTGRCIVTTSWQDEAALAASRAGIAAFRDGTAGALGGEPEVAEWQIAAMHRVHEQHSGACSRVTWLRTAPGAVQRAVDAVRLSLMPKLDDLPGFCSVSVLTRPEEGTAVATVSYDSWDDLRAAAEGAREFREQFAPALGIEVLGTADLDLLVAHLRVPETL